MFTASAFVADATADAMQLSARAITACCNTWLQYWDVDAASQAKVVGLPFKSNKLFGDAFDSLLIEMKGKKKVLPSIR